MNSLLCRSFLSFKANYTDYFPGEQTKYSSLIYTDIFIYINIYKLILIYTYTYIHLYLHTLILTYTYILIYHNCFRAPSLLGTLSKLIIHKMTNKVGR